MDEGTCRSDVKTPKSVLYLSWMRALTQARPSPSFSLLGLFGLSLALTLAACDDGLLLSENDVTPRKLVVQVDDFSPGTVQLVSQPLSLRLKEDVGFSSWEIRVLSSSGVVLWEQSIPARDEVVVPVILPEDWAKIFASPEFSPRLVLSASLHSLAEKKSDPLEVEIPFFLLQSLPELAVSWCRLRVGSSGKSENARSRRGRWSRLVSSGGGPGPSLVPRK